MNFIRSRHKTVTHIGKAQGNYPVNLQLESPSSIRLRRVHSRSSRWTRSQVVQGYPTAIAADAALSPSAPSLNPWLSGRNLDFCLLAVCSCVLAVLCHQSLPLPASSSMSSPSALSTSPTSPGQIDFTVKAGLFTTSHQKDDGAENPKKNQSAND